ncbi:hypothetical protein E2C01_053155 [Portunus trituberculatus]|uniref:Uncharacterized protein n=1 Tax=Portunus trituberculatus TaxID=210409 RepID=A0A5B7GFN4_PORTR|nr:hypothetical protein [Portunus trituberculatus]
MFPPSPDIPHACFPFRLASRCRS